MLSAGLTSFLTGITEPLEFSFLFVAPVLYGIHVILAGTSFLVMHLLHIQIGMTFSGGFIDYVLYGFIKLGSYKCTTCYSSRYYLCVSLLLLIYICD